MPQSITAADGTKVNYSYFSDGSKFRAVSDNGEKLIYAGSLRLKAKNYNAVPESFAIAGGRVKYDNGSWQTEYYITDHLGSVRAVTDTLGNVLATFDYTPYGELLAATDNTATGTDHLFTGKEQQSKLGVSELYDSQARFMGTDGRFTSMDPLAEKYYHLSPYAYCAGDPVNLVDPDGRKIIINDGTKDYTWKKIDNQWGFYDNDNKIYSGDLEYINEYSNALMVLLDTNTGHDLVTTLVNDEDFVVRLTYKDKNDKSSYKRSEKSIKWNYINPEAVPTEIGSNSNAITNLGHELAHAVFHRNGNYLKKVWYTIKIINEEGKIESRKISVSEIFATHHENKLRAELYLPLRTHFTKTGKANGVGDRYPIIQDGKSLYYDVYENNYLDFQILPYYIEPYSYRKQ